MPDKSVYNWPNIAVALGGGLASAAVFAVISKGFFAGLLLAHLAPLPLMIVALAFGVGHGATAALFATVLLSLWPQQLLSSISQPQFGMVYGLLVAAPAWLAAYAAMGAPRGGRDRLTTHLPGWAVFSAAATLVAVIGAWVVYETFAKGSLDEVLTEFKARFYLILRQVSEEQGVGDKIDPAHYAGVLVRTLPATIAAHLLMVHALNLWAAGHLARLSGGLPAAQWPDIAMELALPRAAAALFVLGVGLSFVGDGVVAPTGYVIAMTFGLALAFQGLAVTHAFLRASKSSVLVLAVMYFVVGLLGWPLALFAVLGAADTIFAYRSRWKTAAVKRD